MRVNCNAVGYHPATGLDLVEGEMDVTEEQAATLEAAGLTVQAPKKRATKPEKED